MIRRSAPPGPALLLIAAAGAAAAACATVPPPTSPSAAEASAVADDRSAETLYQSGVDAEKVGDGARAEQYFGAAIQRGYPIDKAFPALINVCLASDRFDTALHYARARLLKEPGDWPLRYLVATLLVSAGQDKRAMAEIHRLMDERPGRAEPHYLLAVLARDSLGDRGTAQRSFTTYLALAPDGPHADEARAFLNEEQRTTDEEKRQP